MSVLRLEKPSVCPRDGFRYVFPEDGYVAWAWTYNDWIAAAKAHYHANPELGEEPRDLEARMESQLCQTLDPGWCMYDDPMRPRASTSLTWDDVQRGLKTFAEWTLGGCKSVAQTEADRRAEVCSRCYMNVNVTGCSACQKVVEEIVGNWKSKSDQALKSCAVCKCFLRAKVHFPLETLDIEAASLQSLYPEHCWLKRGGPNFNG